MAEALTVNRCLKDKAMDRIDHALGRPLHPLAETYRDHFAVREGDLAETLRASPHWEEARAIAGGLIFFVVSRAGREALAEHLREIGSPHREYRVAFDGHEWPVIEVSRSKARYSAWLDVSDCWTELSFGEFMAKSTVRLADA